MLRTFVAVEISEAVHRKAAELIRALQAAEAGVKWVETHNQHLTLQFLGDVAEERIPGIAQAVERGVEKLGPFFLEIAGAGAFPNVHKPRTLWLGAKEGAEQMADLHERVASALAGVGIRDEDRRYQPHLTIGRVRNFKNLSLLSGLLKQYADFNAGKTLIDQVVLFSSRLQSGGPVYTPLAKVILKEGST
ncbi:MAG: RNA 2',3'-cyclic phosphodiesterase [Pirellulales bacterium]|nr:RNA 2',3'-cyclic phosphodiesterase [Pirellulales bacterium]